MEVLVLKDLGIMEAPAPAVMVMERDIKMGMVMVRVLKDLGNMEALVMKVDMGMVKEEEEEEVEEEDMNMVMVVDITNIREMLPCQG